MNCPTCVADVPDDDLFCENCGAKLVADPEIARCTCGGPADDMDEDGFCLSCGRRLRRPASDHIEEELSATFAAVSDRGLRHDRNEDRFALVAEEDGFALIVCDGVSTTRESEVASATVTEIVASRLRESLLEGPVENPEQLLLEAIAESANALASETESRSGEQPPSTTVVAALVTAEEITLAWAGDSRAYWIDEQGAVALTRDHSWLHDVVAAGEMTEEEALLRPQAHAITRWLGADADQAASPETLRHPRQGSGSLLLCSDGLWNYAPDPEAMSRVYAEASAGSMDAITTARNLVNFANAQGGRDNITVALLQLREASKSEADLQSIEPTDV